MSRLSSLKRREFGLNPVTALSTGNDNLVYENHQTDDFYIEFFPLGDIAVFLNGLLLLPDNYTQFAQHVTIRDFRIGDNIGVLYLKAAV